MNLADERMRGWPLSAHQRDVAEFCNHLMPRVCFSVKSLQANGKQDCVWIGCKSWIGDHVAAAAAAAAAAAVCAIRS